ncbi:MAG: DNA-3-methyladenine glycosylase I [Oligoflexia bacterium]|nr:DNA-3-methyladenine glycosylase I [Oligoflexia bacterium]
MQPFSEIHARALDRHGDAALDARLPVVRTAAQLCAMPDDRFLAAMARAVFQAGFVWRVIASKWPGFETAFLGFEPDAVCAMDETAIDALHHDTRIVRNGQKIVATLRNAAWVQAVSAQQGGFGRWLSGCPEDDIVGLWAQLKLRGARLGGDTGPRVLRAVGKDTFILSSDVRAALVDAGVPMGKGASKRDHAAAQVAFNAWRAETGLPLAHLSVIAASSTGQVHA